MKILTAQEYNERFQSWREEKLQTEDFVVESIKRRSGEGTVKHECSREELLSFAQCYSEDPRVKYARARKELPPYWFISREGNVVSFAYGRAALLTPSRSGEKRTGEQIEISSGIGEGICLDPGTLVNLTFGGAASQRAEKRLNEIGILELKAIDHVSSTQLHHRFGKVLPETDTAQDRDRCRAINCQLDRTIFLTDAEHKLITNFPAKDKDGNKDLQLSKLKEFAQVYPGRETGVAVISYEHGHGDLVEGLQWSDLKWSPTAERQIDFLLFCMFQDGLIA